MIEIGNLCMSREMLFSPANYLITAIIYLILGILSLRLYLVFRQAKKGWYFYFLGIALESFCIVLHTSYWCFAKFVDACGMKELYAQLSAPIPFALAQGFETIGGIVMLIVFIVAFFGSKKKE